MDSSNSSEKEVIWTRGYSDDYWNDPVSPLFFELLGDQLTQIVNTELNGIMGYSRLGSGETDKLLRLYHGHAYFNLEVLKRKVEYEIPPFVRNDDILNYFMEGSGPYGKKTMKNQPFKLNKRVLAEIRVMLYDGQGSITKTNSAYEKWTKEKFDPFWQNFDSRIAKINLEGDQSDLLELAGELDRLMIGHFRLVRYGIPVHNIGMNLIAQYLLGRFIGQEATEIYPLLISGLEHKTSEMNERLVKLAGMIRTSTPTKSLILETPSNRLFTVLMADNTPQSEEFKQELKSFLRDFGVRGFTREPYYPRWHEAPEYVFDILKSLIQDQIPVKKEQKIARKLQTSRIEHRIKKRPLGWFKWQLLSVILGFARKYIVFRENQRYNLDRWITMNRRIYMDIGRNLQKHGFLEDPSDIFFLRKNEIRTLISRKGIDEDQTRIRQAVSSRKAEFLKYEHVTPAKFLQGSTEFNDPERNTGFILHGLPASQGRLTGTVRVLNRVEEIGDVHAGEILVVPRTDPGWTPVFSKIGGLITETGGILSHGAVVSREYGIPAVTNIQNACQLLHNGQTVTIDGSKGIISI
ncbi:MAG: PEP-utilizing enzyme [Candidatus Bathyarchaeia archaeon]|jgi:pyruvate,water dikinase